ncbi:phosphatidylinositol-binding protein scs2 [Apophysomyces ossiformis]|uniref:Phosphatidylinositol-binding protein scs2 n=1 Tax=Apophysomyces ossiformis TaxID=679940 RepID=A0A8H7BSL3_9FUNG|nr:phosphatidylinositol-binding protein scs2 [Apophysomyces ossiformis]
MDLELANELIFTRPWTEIANARLSILNTTSELVAFKIKTTAPRQYIVRPNCGLLHPHKSIEVRVIRQPFPTDPPEDYRCKDKFLVESIRVTKEMDTKDMQGLWSYVDTQMRHAVQQHKLRCMLVLPDETTMDQKILRRESEVACEKLVRSSIYTEQIAFETAIEHINQDLKALQRQINEHATALRSIEEWRTANSHTSTKTVKMTRRYPSYVLILTALLAGVMAYVLRKEI